MFEFDWNHNMQTKTLIISINLLKGKYIYCNFRITENRYHQYLKSTTLCAVLRVTCERRGSSPCNDYEPNIEIKCPCH